MNLEELNRLKEKTRQQLALREGPTRYRVVVSLGTSGIAAGARAVMTTMVEEIERRGLDDVDVRITGELGLEDLEPVVRIEGPGGEQTTYAQLGPDGARQIVAEHLQQGRPCTSLLPQYPEASQAATTPRTVAFFAKQVKVVLENCGVIDPKSLPEYVARDGYAALGKVLAAMTPEQVIDEIKASGLRGRGGAGFPTGVKWELLYQAPDPQKYVVCNADEGDPGAFMNRAVLEGDPHRVIEGMAIGAYAMGARRGFIYIRAEYPVAIKRLQLAIRRAYEAGLLGQRLFESPFGFDLELRIGAGAFVCGEETAMIRSIEGRRGQPQPRPPYPAQRGVWGHPTNINNVETWAAIKPIIQRGAAWYASIGTEKTKGTKVFALAGRVRNTGLVEVPFGTTLREIIFEIGGGIPGGKHFKAVQTGGPSGGVIPAQHLDTPVEYESLQQLGSIMGSGGLVVMDQDSCMVDLARFFLEFCCDESCGKCPPCRVGTRQLLNALERICDGDAGPDELERLEKLVTTIKNASLCGLGQAAPNPVLTTLKYFRDEYLAHLEDRRCPAKVCRRLLHFTIDPDQCVGCSDCARQCPTNTIYKVAGQKKYFIVEDNCTQCSACVEACDYDAVIKGSDGRHHVPPPRPELEPRAAGASPEAVPA